MDGLRTPNREIAAPKPSPWGEGGSPDGLTDEGHTAVGEERRKKGGAQHRPYGMDEPRTSNREIATAALQPRDDRKNRGRNDRRIGVLCPKAYFSLPRSSNKEDHL